MGVFKRVRCVFHGLQDSRVRVGPFQGLPLHLDGAERAIDLLELLFVPFLPLQGLNGRWMSMRRECYED